MYENRSESLAPFRVFITRVLLNALVAFSIIAASLGIGTVGYRIFGHLAWIDALLNAAMILTGMGPVDPMKTDAGKLFAAFYALFSGIVFLSMIAIIMAPIFHRFLHAFHLPDEDDDQDRQD